VRNLYYDGLDVLINHVEERTGTRVKVRQDADLAEGPPTSQAEWAWLVRFCGRFVPDQATAEDLTQETLIVAWQGAHELRDPAARTAWLAGIARRRCLMWWRRRQREMAHLAEVPGRRGSPSPSVEALPDDGDLEIELERDELAHVLDHALALLPAETGQVLVQHYVDGLPQAAIAARLGVSEGTLAVRLHRGKLALRRVLATDLARDAATYGVGGAPGDGWQQTRLWCPSCGQRHLVGQLEADRGSLMLHCPGCAHGATDLVTDTHIAGLFAGIKGYKAAVTRLMTWMDRYYGPALRGRTGPCIRCAPPALLRAEPLSDAPTQPQGRSVSVICPVCVPTPPNTATLAELCLALPDGRQFWREHPRIRALPEYAVEAGGRAALVLPFESVREHARFDVIRARDTYEVLHAHRTPGD